MKNCPFMIIAARLVQDCSLTGECLDVDCVLWLREFNCCSFKMIAVAQSGKNIYEFKEKSNAR